MGFKDRGDSHTHGVAKELLNGDGKIISK